MRLEKLLSLGMALTMMSSCAVSMKMQGNHFESSEVYGKTGGRMRVGARGQSKIELTPDYTLFSPNTNHPDIGPTHHLTFGGGMGIGERFEVGLDTTWMLSGKFQILGDPKLAAEEGNISLAAKVGLGFNSLSKEGSGWFSNQTYRTSLDSSSQALALIAGYRVDKVVNLYTGPFIESGSYKGTYEVVGVSKSAFEGKGLNKGAVIGVEFGKPQLLLMLEGAWNHTVSASSKNDFWVGGIEGVLSF